MAFFYDNTQSYEDNFQRWWKAKTLEAEVHNISAGDETNARKKFDSYFGKKKVKITRIKNDST